MDFLRLGLYDFFSYTIPGIFYLLIAAYTAALFGWITVDWATLNQVSLLVALVVAGAGYVVGITMNNLAHKWYRISKRKSSRMTAYQQYRALHHEDAPRFQPEDWILIFAILRRENREYAEETERFNVYAAMLRNVSFGSLILAAAHGIRYVGYDRSWWLLAAAIGSLLFSWLAIREAQKYARWFYLSVFQGGEAQLLQLQAFYNPVTKPADTHTAPPA